MEREVTPSQTQAAPAGFSTDTINYDKQWPLVVNAVTDCGWFLNKVFLYVTLKHGQPSNRLAPSKTMLGKYRYVIFDTFVRNIMNFKRKRFSILTGDTYGFNCRTGASN